MPAPEHIDHPFGPLFDENSRTLVLGTMPSPKSREQGFYYGHPRNRFWNVLATLFDEPAPATIERKTDLVLRHHIALWDVLASCTIEGASDASISDARPNDLSLVLANAPIERVVCTGAKSAELYEKLCEPSTGMPAAKVPSTSPANAACSLQDLVDAYAFLAQDEIEHRFTPPTLDVADVVALERTIADNGTSLAELMQRAGLALAHRIRTRTPQPHGRIVILCGSGNNGGDGWVAACDLARQGLAVTLVSSRAAKDIKTQPAHDAAEEATETLKELGAHVMVNPASEDVEGALGHASVIVDALLGTGFDGDNVKEPAASWIRAANRQRERGALIVAADVPSGLSAQTGQAAEPCIQADETVTMIVSKPGLHTADGQSCCCAVTVAPLAYIEPLLAREERAQG